MQVKLLEIRDRATFIPCFAMRMTPQTQCSPAQHDAQRYLLHRAGYSCEYSDSIVLFGALNGGNCYYDPYDWPGLSRTYKVAHQYVTEHFDELCDGAVIDVEFILGEAKVMKMSERYDAGDSK